MRTPVSASTRPPRKSAQELNHADFIGFDREDTLLDGLNSKGLRLTQKNFGIVAEDHLVRWQPVKEGLGIGMAARAHRRGCPWRAIPYRNDASRAARPLRAHAMFPRLIDARASTRRGRRLTATSSTRHSPRRFR